MNTGLNEIYNHQQRQYLQLTQGVVSLESLVEIHMQNKTTTQQIQQIQQLLFQNQQITPEQQITQLQIIYQQQEQIQQQIYHIIKHQSVDPKLLQSIEETRQLTRRQQLEYDQQLVNQHQQKYQQQNLADVRKNFAIITRKDREGSYRENFSDFIDTILSFNTRYLLKVAGNPSTIKEYIYLKIKSYVSYVGNHITIPLPEDKWVNTHVAGGIYGGTSWNYHFSDEYGEDYSPNGEEEDGESMYGEEEYDDYDDDDDGESMADEEEYFVEEINKKAVLPGNYDIFFSLNLMNNQQQLIPGIPDSLQEILTFFESEFVEPTAGYLRVTIYDYLEKNGIKEPWEYFQIYCEKAKKKITKFKIGDQVKVSTFSHSDKSKKLEFTVGRIDGFEINAEETKYKVTIQDQNEFTSVLEENLSLIPQEKKTENGTDPMEYHMPYKGTWSGGYEKSSTKSYGFKIFFGRIRGRRGRRGGNIEDFSNSIFSNLDEEEDDSSIINKKLLFYLEIQINTINNERLLTLFNFDEQKKYCGLNIPGLNLVSSFLLEKKTRSKNKGFDIDIVRDNMLHRHYEEAKLQQEREAKAQQERAAQPVTKQIEILQMLFGGEWDNIFSNNIYSRNNLGVKEDWDNLRCNILRKILEDEKTEAVITGANAGNRIKDQQILSKLMNEFSGGGHPKYSQFFKVLTDKILNDMPGGGNGKTGLPSFRQLIDFVISGTNYLGQHVRNFQGQQVNGIFRLEGSGGDAIRHYLPDAITSTADFDTKLFINETITVENQIDGAPPITGGKDRTKTQAFSRPSLDVARGLNIPFNKGFYNNYHQKGRINMRYYLEVKMTILVAIISKILDDYKFFRFNFEYTVNVPSFGNFQCVLDSTQQENITRIRKLNDYTVDTPDFKSLLSLDARLKIRWYLLEKYIGYSFYEFPPLDMAFYDGSKKLKHVLGKNDSIRSIGVTGSTSLFTVNDGKTGLLTPLPSLGGIYQDLQKNMEGERAKQRAVVGKKKKDRDRINAFNVKYQNGNPDFYLPGNATPDLDQFQIDENTGKVISLEPSKHQDFINIQHIFYKLIPLIFNPNVTTENLTDYYLNISNGDVLTIVNAQLLLLLARSKGRKKLPYGHKQRAYFWKSVSQDPDVKESIRKYKLSYGGRKKKTIKKFKKKIKKSKKKNEKKVKKKGNFRKSRGQVRKKLNFRKSRRKISKNKPKKKEKYTK